MNRHILLFICLFFCGIFFSYAQGIRPPGIYEVGDTTIEVYDLKELNAIREFKIINGTDHILFREFNRLTKKLREEGMFTAGYSSGKWKFYNLLGRVKKEVDYDNQVKTVHNTKLDAAPLNSLAFDYEKYKADSVTAERYWRMKREGTSSNAPVAKKTEQSAMQDSGQMHKGISASGMSPVAGTPTTLAAKKDVQKTEADSARQKTENSLFKKLWSSKKESAPSKNKSGYVPPGTDSATVKKEVEKNETAANAIVKAPPAKKGSRKGTSGYVPPSATEEKKPLAKETTEEPVNVKKETAISKRPTEHSEKSAEDKQPEERKNETVKNSSKKETGPENKPVEQKKETAKEAKQEANKKSEVVKNTTKPAEKESITAIKPAEKKKEVLKEVKKQDAQKEEGMKNTSLTDVKTESVAVSKPNEQKKEAPKKEIMEEKEATSHIEKEKIRTEETLLKKEEQGAKKESSVNTNKQEAVKKEATQSAVKKEKTVSDTKTEKSKKEAIKEKPEQSLIKKTEAKKESDRSVAKTADTSASAKQSQAKTKATADQKPKSHVTVADSLNSKKDSLSLKNTINPTNVSDTTAKQKTNKG